jgi:hypothetical protein
MKHIIFVWAAIAVLIKVEVVAQTKTPSQKETISNAGKAKPPKGKLNFKLDGTLVITPENKVQCMLVGMGNDMAQSVISATTKDLQLTVVYVGKPAIGEVPEKKGSVPNIGFSITKNGVMYSNMLGGTVKLIITKITPDGKNYYAGGTFTAELKSKDGKVMKVTEGTFESAYL